MGLFKTKEEKLLEAIRKENVKKVKSIIYETNKSTKSLNNLFNEKDKEIGNYPLLESVVINNVEIVNIIIEYANKNSITLNINEKNKNGNYPLLYATDKNNTEIVKILIDYANKNNILLDINEKNNKGLYPLLYAIYNNNTTIVKLIIDYAISRKIIIYMNENDMYGNNPITGAIVKNNTEMVKLILDYIESNKIVLRLNEQNLQNIITNNNKICNINSISDINTDIIKLLYRYKNEEKIDYFFTEPSELLKKFKSIPMALINKTEENSESKASTQGKSETPKTGTIKKPEAPKRPATSEQTSNSNNPIQKQKPTISARSQPPKTNDLAIVLYNFKGSKKNDLEIHRKDFVIVTNWNKEKGWAYGYKKDNPQKKGMFPNNYIKKCSEALKAKKDEVDTQSNEKQGLQSPSLTNNSNEIQDLTVAIYDFKSTKKDELEIHRKEFIIVTNWTSEKGWAYGYKKNDPQQKGIFPSNYVKKYIKSERVNKEIKKQVIKADSTDNLTKKKEQKEQNENEDENQKSKDIKEIDDTQNTFINTLKTNEKPAMKEDEKNQNNLTENIQPASVLSMDKEEVPKDLAIVLYNYNSTKKDELELRRKEFIIVTNWNVEEGWASGYKKDDPLQVGNFPKDYVRKCSNKIKSKNEKESTSAISSPVLPKEQKMNNKRQESQNSTKLRETNEPLEVHDSKMLEEKKETNINNINKEVSKKNIECTSKSKDDSDVHNADLAIVLYNFISSKKDELEIYRKEFIMVTDWNIEEGWAYGYKKDDPQKKGSFPNSYVKKCSNKMKTKEEMTNSSINDDKKSEEQDKKETNELIDAKEKQELQESLKENNQSSSLSMNVSEDQQPHDLAIVLYNYISSKKDELELYRKEFIIVTNWNIEEGWAYGYKKDDPQKKGSFPTNYVKKYTNKMSLSSSNSSLNNNISKNEIEQNKEKEKELPDTKKIPESPKIEVDRKQEIQEKPVEKSQQENETSSSISLNKKENEDNDLAIVLYNFESSKKDELGLSRKEFIIVTNWNIEKGWAYGYKRNDPEKKGSFPNNYVKKCTNKMIEKLEKDDTYSFTSNSTISSQ
jgi:hypothetical protein